MSDKDNKEEKKKKDKDSQARSKWTPKSIEIKDEKEW